MRWLQASSGAALEAVEQGTAHLGGIHLRGETGEYNLPAVRERVPGASVLPFARWELGLVSSRSRKVLGPKDLPGTSRFINREPGSGARQQLERRLAANGIAHSSIKGFRRVVRSHLAVAQAVALGAANVGLASLAAARAFDLSFVPWCEERFDLVIPPESVPAEVVSRLVQILRSRSFRRELGALDGYGEVKLEVIVA